MDENENIQETDAQDTIPEDVGETKTDVANCEESTVIPDGEQPQEESITRDTDANRAQISVSEKTDVNEPFISVQYNHQKRDLSKEEAIGFIQKGMHTESLRAKLDSVAALHGVDVNTMVDMIVSAPENAYRKHLEQLYGKNSKDVDIGMEIYRQKQSKEYKNIVTQRENNIIKNEQKEIQSVNSRLADEYIMLKSEIPDAPEYGKLPDSVIIEAAEGKRDLYSAYLCYLHKEKMNIDAAKKTQTSAALASSGTMKSGGGDKMSSAGISFLSGLWSKG